MGTQKPPTSAQRSTVTPAGGGVDRPAAAQATPTLAGRVPHRDKPPTKAPSTQSLGPPPKPTSVPAPEAKGKSRAQCSPAPSSDMAHADPQQHSRHRGKEPTTTPEGGWDLRPKGPAHCLLSPAGTRSAQQQPALGQASSRLFQKEPPSPQAPLATVSPREHIHLCP